MTDAAELRDVLYTVPWFPELAMYRTPQVPGPIIQALIEVAEQARSVANPFMSVGSWVGILTVLSGQDESSVRKVLWLADRLGLISAGEAVSEEMRVTG